MTLDNYVGENYQTSACSHSFNQFVIHNGETFVLLDHAYGIYRPVLM